MVFFLVIFRTLSVDVSLQSLTCGSNNTGMPPIPYRIEKQDHPGSSLDDIWNEPNWSITSTNDHPIGYHHNEQGRRPGVTHSADDDADAEITWSSERRALENISKFQSQEHKAEHGKTLLNFRDLMLDERVSSTRVAQGKITDQLELPYEATCTHNIIGLSP